MNDFIKIIYEIKELEEKREPERILPYLSHPSFLVREAASKSIARTGKHLKEKIMEILKKGYWYEKASCLEILGEWGNQKDIEFFLNFLNDKNSLIVEKAAIALFKTIRKLPALPQDFKPEILKKLHQIFILLQKREYANEILKIYKEFFK